VRFDLVAPAARRYSVDMKKMIVSAVLSGLFLAASSYGSVPAVKVTVSDAGGKAAYRGTTNAKGTFATGTLKPGAYVVQFNSNTTEPGSHYALVVSAGKKKVLAEGVVAEKFNGGGVAMRIEVGGGLNIVGQIATEGNTMVRNNKRIVWIPHQLGTNLPGHFAEEDSAEAVGARHTLNISIMDLEKTQRTTVGH
jgi:hypothetical protein